MDLQIRFENGLMVIHLREFLNARNITNVRKLLKIIRRSYTPECEQQIREFIESEFEGLNEKQAESRRYVTGYEQKIRYCQGQLQYALNARDSCKKSTPLYRSEEWEKWNEKVKATKEELTELKKVLHSYESGYSRNIQNRGFYKKVLENIE